MGVSLATCLVLKGVFQPVPGMSLLLTGLVTVSSEGLPEPRGAFILRAAGSSSNL